MTPLEARATWDKQKRNLKQRFMSLTEYDLLFKEGKQDEMFLKLEIKLGKTKKELLKIMGVL